MLVGSQLLRLAFLPLSAIIFLGGQRGGSLPAIVLETLLILLSISTIISALSSIRSAIEFFKTLPN